MDKKLRTPPPAPPAPPNKLKVFGLPIDFGYAQRKADKENARRTAEWEEKTRAWNEARAIAEAERKWNESLDKLAAEQAKMIDDLNGKIKEMAASQKPPATV